MRLVHEVNGVDAEQAQELVQNPGAGRKDLVQDGDDHHRGDKARHIRYRLNELFEFFCPHLVEQNGKKNGDGKIDEDVPYGKHQRVAQSAPEHWVTQKTVKIAQRPFRAERALARPVAPERKHVAHHGDILKYNIICDGQYQHRIQHPVTFEMFSERFALRGFRVRRQYGCLGHSAGPPCS